MSENSAREIRSTVTSKGTLELSIANQERPVPDDNEVLVKVEAAPINPSDLALLISFAANLDAQCIKASHRRSHACGERGWRRRC